MVVVSDYPQMSQRVRDVLRDAFGPNISVHTDEGEYGGVFVKVVSDQFDGLAEREKQDRIWRVLRERLGAESQSVALVLAIGLDQV